MLKGFTQEMENINETINEIIHRQQVLEYLNTNHPSTDILSDAYANKIIIRCKQGIGSSKPIVKNFIYKIIGFIVRSSLCAFILWLIGTLSYYFVMVADSSQPPLTRVEIAIELGDYDTAHTILTEMITDDPMNSQILILYAELFQLEGQHDEAAMTLINYLNNICGTQNIQNGNELYMKLKELSGPFSPDVENAYQKCIANCKESIEIFDFLNTLMKNEKYQMALHLCDSMQQENVSDEYLYIYYYTCYTQLGEYETCTDYFLGLADNWKEETYLDHLLLKTKIQNRLNDLRHYVPEATQEKINAACSKLDQEDLP